MSDHAEIARLLDASRRAHQRYRENIPRRVPAGATTLAVAGNGEAANAALLEACRLRTEADALDPGYEAPAWRDEPRTHNHHELLAFYAGQLAR